MEENSLFILIIISITIGFITLSYYLFNKRLTNLTNVNSKHLSLEEKIKKELIRIEKLKHNKKEIQINIQKLDIPSPEELTETDDMKSTLTKLSIFYEKHNVKIAGIENTILSLLPISQTGASLQALYHTLPPDLGEKLFADVWPNLQHGIHPDSISDFAEKFLSGMSDLSHTARHSMMTAFNHHDYFNGIMTPIKHGAMEALGINDSISDISSSLHDIGADLSNAAENCAEFAELTDVANIDITGHLPIITITMSTIREVQLLADNKTNILSALGHITLDTIGTGGGGLVGTIIGVCTGALTQSPTGIIIGAIVGGIMGGIYGRKITNWIKTRPYRKAVEKYTEKYNLMIKEKKSITESTFTNIRTYANNKRTEFKNSKILEKTPIYETNETISKITFIIYQTIVKELYNIKKDISKLKHSFWFSSKKHSTIINDCELKVNAITSALPSVENITTNSQEALTVILGLNLPCKNSEKNLADVTTKCYMELKEMNDKNDSAILFWAYMVENYYRNTLNEVATYSNSQMKELNEVFNRWDTTIKKLEKKVLKEKGKLGLS